MRQAPGWLQSKIKGMKCMSRYVWHWMWMICVICTFANQGQTSTIQNQFQNKTFQLIDTTSGRLTIEFTPQSWSIDSLQIKGELFQRFNFQDAVFSEESGKPQLPYSCVLVGIPINAKIQYEILKTTFEEFKNVKLAPVPTIELKDGMPTENYSPDEQFYHSDEEFPENIIKIDPPGFMRNQPVVRIFFFPIQYIPKLKRIRKYNQIKVRLVFHNIPPSNLKLIPIEKNESLYQQALLNYHQARQWRQSPGALRMRKRFNSFEHGEWYAIPIEQEGMYKITGQFLLDNGISLASVDPKTIRIYNNSGRQLPEALYAQRPDSLIENAILVDDGGDGKFDAMDAIIFYGRGVEGYTYDRQNRRYKHYIHHYTTKNIYWLTWGNNQLGKRMEEFQSQRFESPTIKSSFKDFQFREEEQLNELNSGTFWLGRHLTKDKPTVSYAFDISGADTTLPLNVRLRLGTESSGYHSFRIKLNDQPLGTVSLTGISSVEQVNVSLNTFLLHPDAKPKEGLNYIHIDYLSPQNYHHSYIDWIEIDYYRRLTFNESSIIFNSSPDSGLIEYHITNTQNEQIVIYDISQYHTVRRFLPSQIKADAISFADSVSANSPKRYIALKPSSYQQITLIEKKSAGNIDLSTVSADYLIVTPASFYEEALTLKSLRENMDSLKTNIVLISDIFNEFGWGLPDPTAIRDFVKYAFEKGRPQPSYVLLLGDGHYDYKGIFKGASTNWIPPYETNETSSIQSRVMDEWFVRVKGNDPIMDLAIGRLPVNSPGEARQLIHKICAYEASKDFGYWRNTITLVADDDHGQGGEATNELEHTQQTEDIAAVLPEHFYTRKIYMVEYPAVRSGSVSGITKPLVNRDIIEQLNQGTVIIDMIGHSKEDQFTHENVFSLSSEVPKLRNGTRLPLLISASCAFGRFDDPLNQWITEELLLIENGGAIATFASARLAFSLPNGRLNTNFMKYLFNTADHVRRLGDAMRLAKAITPGENSEKYHLLGDPALILNVPEISARIDSIQPDSMQALSKMNIFGHIHWDEKFEENFQGNALIRAFDLKKNRSYTTEHNATINYTLPGNSIFRGSCKINAGKFNSSFIVPKDISYGGTTGCISVYVWDDSRAIDGIATLGGIYVGGTASTIKDLLGPNIWIGIKGREFKSGDLIDDNPSLKIILEDSLSGINITNEIGHTITLMLDNDPKAKQNITHYFNYDEGSYVRGTIEYPLFNLASGEHQLELKAWDNFNNSSQKSVAFFVASEEELVLRYVLNFPNPFAFKTNFTFEINQSADINIKIYTLAGRLLRSFSDLRANAGYNFEYEWDGRDETGSFVANGVYLYKIIATKTIADEELKAEKLGKLIIMR